MSASLLHPTLAGATAPAALRFGAETQDADRTTTWQLKRNCSATPQQMLGFYASLTVLSLVIGTFFWVQGATLVMPFAWLELAAVAVALLLYARHATDRETICLQRGRLVVERVSGRITERAEFAPSWVRVEPAHGARSLVELSGQGQRICVGRFVRPELRRQLADELKWALRRWQGDAPREKSEN